MAAEERLAWLRVMKLTGLSKFLADSFSCFGVGVFVFGSRLVDTKLWDLFALLLDLDLDIIFFFLDFFLSAATSQEMLQLLDLFLPFGLTSLIDMSIL